MNTKPPCSIPVATVQLCYFTVKNRWL